MKKVLIVEDNPRTLKELIDLFIPDEIGESPDYDLTICTCEDIPKQLDPGLFDYILLDHDLPNRGNSGRILNEWFMNFEVTGTIRSGTYDGKMIAISCVPINNQRLLELGCNCAINKMDSDWLERLKKEIMEK